jgi:hypothetical protein
VATGSVAAALRMAVNTRSFGAATEGAPKRVVCSTIASDRESPRPTLTSNMPISGDEFRAGRVETTGEDRPTDAEAEEDADRIETEKDLITSFWSERQDRAFTEREIVLGVDFTPALMNRTRNPLGSLADGLINIAGDVTATTIVVNDVDEALEQLVAEEIVVRKQIERDDSTTAYYQLV